MGSPLAGSDSDVWMSASPSLNTTNESCTDSGDHIHYTASVHAFWDETQPLTVQNSPNGTTGWVTVSDYVFGYGAGQITFNTARGVGTNNFTRISTGYYFNVTQLDASFKWAATGKGKTVKTTSFQAVGQWETNLATTRGFTGTIETYRNDSRIWAELIATNNLVMLQLYIDKSANMRYQCAARLTAIDQESDVKAAQMQKVTFEVQRDMFLLLV